ncbi:MAG TPA: lactate racemase domain-containing protein, partial [Candidatus Acidoferrum sp.]|nr:lactate racemase domain-containing protein [Candidatus Acidoferrum sp.]
MKSDLTAVLKDLPMASWKKVNVEFTGGPLSLLVPPDCAELTMRKAEALKNPAREIEAALDHPIGSRRLEQIIQEKEKPISELRVAITVSDITRPVPYLGPGGILLPLLNKSMKQGVRKENIL